MNVLAKANDIDDPVLRLMQVVWWFFASNPLPDAKKPLNPTLGEVSRAKHLSSFTRQNSIKKFEVNGNMISVDPPLTEGCTWSLAEQLSHHPPVTAHYSENKKLSVGIHGFFETKAKFTGTGVKLTFEGETSLMVNKYNEVYSCTSPTVVFKIIRLAAEVVGEVHIACNNHPYKAVLKFKEKPLLRGEANKVKGAIVDAQGKEVTQFAGIWTKHVVMTDLRSNLKYTFTPPTGNEPEYPPFESEQDNSARKVWQHVKQATSGSRSHKAKQEVEEEQRRRAKARVEKGEEWQPIYFEKLAKEGGNLSSWRLKNGVNLEFN